MIYVPEILQARYDDNKVQAKEYREYLVELDDRIKSELDSKAKEGMYRERTDIYYEYESLGRENDEIRTTLKLIRDLEMNKKRKEPQVCRPEGSIHTQILNLMLHYSIDLSLLKEK